MLIYNVTSKVAWPIHESWVQWMKEVHIPEVMSTGCFLKYQLVRLLETDEEEGPTYAIQYYADNRIAYDNYISKYAPPLRQKTLDAWGNQFIAFRSIMEIID